MADNVRTGRIKVQVRQGLKISPYLALISPYQISGLKISPNKPLVVPTRLLPPAELPMTWLRG